MLDGRRVSATHVVEAEGRLGPLTLPSLVHDICEEKNTGVLAVRDGDIEKAVFIEKGRIVFAKSNDKNDRLGTLILRRGMVSLRDMVAAGEISKQTGQRLGGVLVERGNIRPQDLVAGVRDQVKEITVSLFHWSRGTYEMKVGPLPSNEVITLKMSTGDIILEGLKRVDSWSRIELAVGSPETRYQVDPRVDELSRDVTLSLEEWTLLSRCEGPVMLGLLCEASPMKDYDVCRLVWALNVVGMLKRLD